MFWKISHFGTFSQLVADGCSGHGSFVPDVAALIRRVSPRCLIRELDSVINAPEVAANLPD
jgi:hypothetical protein